MSASTRLPNEPEVLDARPDAAGQAAEVLWRLMGSQDEKGTWSPGDCERFAGGYQPASVSVTVDAQALWALIQDIRIVQGQLNRLRDRETQAKLQLSFLSSVIESYAHYWPEDALYLGLAIQTLTPPQWLYDTARSLVQLGMDEEEATEVARELVRKRALKWAGA